MTLDTWELILAALVLAATVAVPLIGWVLRVSNMLSQELSKHATQIEYMQRELQCP